MSERNFQTVTWNYPAPIRFGAGSVCDLPNQCRHLGMAQPLVVTDEGLACASFIQAVCDRLPAAGLTAGLFAQVKGNPVGRNVDDGVRFFKDGRYDGIIALGGGSALDAGKAIALMAHQSAPLWAAGGQNGDWTDIDRADVAPLVAVPTTAGTGSEVGRAAVITDEARHIKKIIFHPSMLPASVILDAELTRGLPPGLTAATGLDAFVHCFEAYCARQFHPMADGIALEGMHLIARSLPRAFSHGDDLTARGDMLAAATMGATAFQKGLGGVHALAHAIGALFDTHHGLTNAVLLPYVMAANRKAIEGRMRRVAEALQIADLSFRGVLDWVLESRAAFNIPHTLDKIGVSQDRLEEIGALAKADPCDVTNPATLSRQDYVRIAACAVKGEI